MTSPSATSLRLCSLYPILYVAWRYIAEQNQRKNAIESELRNARVVQQVLVPAERSPYPWVRH